MLFGSVVFAAVIVVDCIVSSFCVVGDDQWDVDQRRKIMKKKVFLWMKILTSNVFLYACTFGSTTWYVVRFSPHM